MTARLPPPDRAQQPVRSAALSRNDCSTAGGSTAAQVARFMVLREIASVNRWMYRHWRAYMAERDAWMLQLRVHLIPKSPPDHFVRATIRSHRARLIDWGNLVGGAKPIPDCLKRLGYIHDDSPQWFSCTYEQVKAPKGQRGTEIMLEAA